MKRIVTTIVLFLLIGLGAFLFYYCGKTDSAIEEAPENSILKIGINNYPRTLNPFFVTDETSQGIINKIYHSLYCYDDKGNLQKKLVESEHLEPDRKEILLRLKRGIFFENGKELNAKDVVATLQILKDNRFYSPYSSNLKFIDRVWVDDGSSVEEDSKEEALMIKSGHFQEKRSESFEVRLRFRKVEPAWRHRLTLKIVSAEELKKVTPESFQQYSFSGTGPYRLFSENPPASLSLTKNTAWMTVNPTAKIHHPENFRNRNRTTSLAPEYFKKAPLFLKYEIITDPITGPLKLLTGEIDICMLQPEDAEAYACYHSWQEQFKLLFFRKQGYTYLVFNMRNPKITRDIRRRIYQILTEEAFCRVFLKKKGEIVCSPFLMLNHPPLPDDYSTGCGTIGNKDQEKDKIPESDGIKKNRIQLQIMTNGESVLRKEFILFLREAVENAFNQKGHESRIELKAKCYEYHTFLQKLKEGNFDIAVSAFVLDGDFNIRDLFHSKGEFNYAGYKSNQMDALLEQTTKQWDETECKQYYIEAQRIWSRDLPLVPLFNLYYYVGVSKRVQIPSKVCRRMTSEGDFLFNIEDWQKK